jgi:hypothetical protein
MDPTPTLCSLYDINEYVSHIFLTCAIAQQVWYWLGQCQLYFGQWTYFDGIIGFATALKESSKTSFLVVLSALCWALWTNRNSLVFNQSSTSSMKNIICLIMSFFNHWSGVMRNSETRMMHLWLPHELDMIPLQMLAPVTQLSNASLVT